MPEVHSMQEILPGYQRRKWLLERDRLSSQAFCLLCVSWSGIWFLLLLFSASRDVGLLLWRQLDQPTESLADCFAAGHRCAHCGVFLFAANAADAGCGAYPGHLVSNKHRSVFRA